MLKRKHKNSVLAALVCVVTLLLVQCTFLLCLSEYEPVNVASSDTDERVKVSDVLSVQDFIARTPVNAHSAVSRFYNKKLSDQIGAFRRLPDTRDTVCHTRSYHITTKQSRVSVVIAFHNEARSTLLRTVMSVYRRTSVKFLHEIILVDDFSVDDSLLASLQQLNFPPFTDTTATPLLDSGVMTMRLHRNPKRMGLIDSRNRGARLATGDYLFFLDSHCEVNVGWLEPILGRLSNSASDTAAVSPVLDSIDVHTLEYTASSQNLKGGFDWSLHFHWQQNSHRSAEPFRSPTFAGGVFMISRASFLKLHGFNSMLKIWGGESIEFSIKLWLCGGSIEIIPCSRIGHIFRQQHSFGFPPGTDGHATYLRNSKIIAESWLDAYKYFFYAIKPAAVATDKDIEISLNEINSTVSELKRALQCRPFSWYMQNVFKELKPPYDDFLAYGTLSTLEGCLQIPKQLKISSTATGVQPFVADCFEANVSHWFLHRHNSRLQSNNGVCLNVDEVKEGKDMKGILARLIVVVQHCGNSVHTQSWQRRGAQLVHTRTQLCLDNTRSDLVTVNPCRQHAPSQLFRFSVEVQKPLLQWE